MLCSKLLQRPWASLPAAKVNDEKSPAQALRPSFCLSTPMQLCSQPASLLKRNTSAQVRLRSRSTPASLAPALHSYRAPIAMQALQVALLLYFIASVSAAPLRMRPELPLAGGV